MSHREYEARPYLWDIFSDNYHNREVKGAKRLARGCLTAGKLSSTITNFCESFGHANDS